MRTEVCLLNIQIHIDFVTSYQFFPARKVLTIISPPYKVGRKQHLVEVRQKKIKPQK